MNDKNFDSKIERALREAPDFELPVSFADKVMNRIETKRQAQRQWEIFWMAFAGFLFVVAAVISIVLTGFKPSFEAFPFLRSYSGLILFGVFFIGALSWLEKKILRKPTIS